MYPNAGRFAASGRGHHHRPHGVFGQARTSGPVSRPQETKQPRLAPVALIASGCRTPERRLSLPAAPDDDLSTTASRRRPLDDGLSTTASRRGPSRRSRPGRTPPPSPRRGPAQGTGPNGHHAPRCPPPCRPPTEDREGSAAPRLHASKLHYTPRGSNKPGAASWSWPHGGCDGGLVRDAPRRGVVRISVGTLRDGARRTAMGARPFPSSSGARHAGVSFLFVAPSPGRSFPTSDGAGETVGEPDFILFVGPAVRVRDEQSGTCHIEAIWLSFPRVAIRRESDLSSPSDPSLPAPRLPRGPPGAAWQVPLVPRVVSLTLGKRRGL
ncbi:hypothetical protein THAOC_11815 [Thalassiosira oceanica]|uniref:Uncharacterized protein n=1 Tax=Thalassiosira oceanica TaxID=159749 RepID=K0SQG1_THAOC|nr:hypothetical protein THAOC_11815 [Thalassiosira oceanica]|eukprot:EJK67184.1 hypothetical protein THAOC_11815 [Thalassiosira oceanica]